MNALAAATDIPTVQNETVYELANVGKTYARNKVVALEGVDLTLTRGSFSSVIGSSGCGKSTLLKIMAGLIPPSTGRVILQDQPVVGPRRDIGMMFQQATLFPWRNTVENIILPIEIRDGRAAAQQAKVRAHDLLEVVGLQGFENVYPNELSGGMAHRASICRMLITEPAVLLLDEPFRTVTRHDEHGTAAYLHRAECDRLSGHPLDFRGSHPFRSHLCHETTTWKTGRDRHGGSAATAHTAYDHNPKIRLHRRLHS